MSSPSPATSTASPPSDSGSPSRLRILELDGLRGVAALAVVLYHFTTRFEQLFPRGPTILAIVMGFHGVVVFHAQRLRDPDDAGANIGWLQFLGRFTRLYPAYWVAAATMTLIVIALAGAASQQVSARDALLNVTMLQAAPWSPTYRRSVLVAAGREVIFYVSNAVGLPLDCFGAPAWGIAAWLLLAAIVAAALAAGW
ncbi:MAG: hypothetical protein R3B96_04025 [Pirellulaceae bacterium]